MYKFDPSTLKTVGAPFRGHISIVTGLALSFDGALLARRHHHQALGFQLLASFYIQEPHSIILSD
jgi:hypothetical protein